MTYEEQLRARTQHVNAVIRDYLPKEEGFQRTLLAAMRYSMEAGGKRLRPLMMDCTFEMFGGRGSLVGPFLAAIEMIHTHSLIHDDLPALDDDAMRRGKKTTHIVYGEAMAILAGDALLNTAYETAAQAFARIPEGPEQAEGLRRVARALTILTQKSGVHGMLGGQSCDVEHDGKPLTEGQVEFINRYKTAALIEASLMIGAVLAGAPDDAVAGLEAVGGDIGLAFQVRDDILDVTGSEQEIGKPIGSDERNRKTTYVTLFGIGAAKQEVEELSARALERFDALPAQHPMLRQLLEELAQRRF